jgi:signal transduction histidine kinase
MASVSLLSRLAQTPRLTELLPPLHEYALEATGGSCSVLFELNPGDGAWYATSGFGLDELGPNPWTPLDPQQSLLDDMFRQHAPVLVTDHGREMPDLVLRLGAPATLLIPLSQGERRLGLLVIGFGSVPGRDWRGAAEIGDAFTSVLEFARLRQKEELESDLQALLERFGESLSTTLSLTSGLEVFCYGARQLFAADRASAWMHDRPVHDLVMLASSDPPHVARGTRISTEAQAPAALGMRRSRAEILPTAGGVPTSTITLPLRGRRRSLGCVVLEGVRVETGRELDMLERADELGRHLSGAIENLQLLDEVIRARRELESTANGMPATIPDQPGDGQGSDRLAALNQVVATVAHEVNNPLQTVLGHLELLRATTTLPKALRRQLQTVYRAADRAARVVRNLLVFAGSRRLVPRPVSLHAVLQKVLSQRTSACRSLRIEVVRHYGHTVPRVQGDPVLLHQVFLNIVLNAEQAIAATGRPGRIEVTTSASARRVVATVRDSGDGIPPEAMRLVFEPFYTTKEGNKATGLGLAIAQAIVLEHGGRLSAANHPNGGATFTVELPVGQKPSPGAVE